MPKSLFKPRFYKSTIEHINQITITHALAYAPEQGTPVYFKDNGSQNDTAKQLNDFKQSNKFITFKKQCEFLLDKLNQWCEHNEIQKIVYDDIKINTYYPAFKLFEQRLFNGYYSIREIIFYDEGKKALEELVILLNNEDIELHIKKDILSNLQESIIVCSDGTLTNIVDAAISLKESLHFDALLYGIKHDVIRNLITLFLQTRFSDENNEIHWNNAFFNYVANDYGLSKKTDKFIDLLLISDKELQTFQMWLENNLKPDLILEPLIRKLSNAFKNIHQQFTKKFFSDETKQIPFDHTVKAVAERLINDWNNKYSMLIKLDLYTMMEIDDALKNISLPLINEAWFKAQITKKFRTHFLTSEIQPIEITNTSRSLKLTYDNGQLWFEENNHFFNPEHSELFLKIELSDSNIYWFFANQLLKFPGQLATIGKIITASDVEISKVLSLWTDNEYYQLISLAASHDLLNHQLLTDAAVFWNLTVDIYSRPEVIDLLIYLIEKELVTSKQLTSAPTSKDHAEVNSIWILANQIHQPKIFSLLIALVKKNPITHVIWILAKEAYQPEIFSLLMTLIEKDLVTSEQLALAPTSGEYVGINSIWMLANKIEQHGMVDLFEQLIDKKLLTLEQLTLAAVTTPYTKKNAIHLLKAMNNKREVHDLLQKIIKLIPAIEQAPSQTQERNNQTLVTMIRNSFFSFLFSQNSRGNKEENAQENNRP
ncbi:MAG: hypothetical protein QM652_03710 [Legionella sp.]|uniref:hypothetical protein n=1 Tax=Legionella sp. TaxID=459 RepID=UPI0039E48BDC